MSAAALGFRPVKLFYSPLARSMATVIALAELGRAAELIAVDHKTRLAPDVSEVHPSVSCRNSTPTTAESSPRKGPARGWC